MPVSYTHLDVYKRQVYQYIQHPMIAKDFAAYLALCNKYKTDYAVEDLLQGKWTPIILGKIRNASLDEHPVSDTHLLLHPSVLVHIWQLHHILPGIQPSDPHGFPDRYPAVLSQFSTLSE